MLRPLTVTAIGVLLFFGLQLIPLPGIDHDVVAMFIEGYGGALSARALFSIGLMGLTPIVTAYIVVELFAIVVPRWQAMRVGGWLARAPLRRAARILALVLAGVQAWGLATSMSVMHVANSDLDVQRWLVIVSLVAATALVLAIAEWMGREGVGNGLAVLWVANTIATRLPHLSSLEAVDEPIGPIALVILILIAWSALIRPALTVASHETDEWPLLLPLCGIWPVNLSLSAGGLWIAMGFLSSDYDTAVSAVLLVTAVLLGFAFNPPARVAVLWRKVRPDSDPRSAVLRGIAMGALLLFGIDLALVLTDAVSLGLDITLLIVAVVFTSDLLYETRYRSEHGDAVAVDELHQTYACAPALCLLERAGVTAHIRGRALRSLFQELGPHFPMTILVPPDQVEAARGALAELRS